VRTVEAFKQVMLKARLVAVPSSTSGIFLIKEVFPRLGIADRVKVKATSRGSDASAMAASGEADIGLLPVSEIVHAPGVDYAGALAEEIQLNQVFAAAVVAASKEIESAKRLIGFLASERAAATIRDGGMEPLGKRHSL
jgi:molybdate transport system substrate-binding protein